MPADVTNEAREQLQVAVRQSLLAQPHATSWIVGETLASVPDVVWDAILALPPEAPIAPDREALAKALKAQGWYDDDQNGVGSLAHADAILATPNLFQSRAEVEAGALEAAVNSWEDPNSREGYAATAWVSERAAAIRSGATK